MKIPLLTSSSYSKRYAVLTDEVFLIFYDKNHFLQSMKDAFPEKAEMFTEDYAFRKPKRSVPLLQLQAGEDTSPLQITFEPEATATSTLTDAEDTPQLPPADPIDGSEPAATEQKESATIAEVEKTEESSDKSQEIEEQTEKDGNKVNEGVNADDVAIAQKEATEETGEKTGSPVIAEPQQETGMESSDKTETKELEHDRLSSEEREALNRSMEALADSLSSLSSLDRNSNISINSNSNDNDNVIVIEAEAAEEERKSFGEEEVLVDVDPSPKHRSAIHSDYQISTLFHYDFTNDSQADCSKQLLCDTTEHVSQYNRCWEKF